MKAYLFSVLLTATITAGCSQPEPATKQLEEKLIGIWELDSTTTVRAGLQKSWNDVTIAFTEDQRFTYYWWQSDLTGKYTGRYFILQNPARALTTVTLVPDLDTVQGEVYRRPYLSFDIESIERNRMVILKETERIELNDQPDKKWFTERSVYRK